ncbi:ECF RNA polymerase sigma-E factor [Lentibacillus sp. JNUCC-1]|uniref:RNA polymerase sigma factor n=1 Tax=Lentibacillus sp. JNUCC-1 TaxID=2654513 RepID=UPI0012E8A5E7|nr:RNA polymerase sigma factor [Lentibacillus sp. JNUCC-1]MUV36684.1 ECF RNA polymerase sigma-E factor [Lentibacillus sp. JNUCC-1]
MDYQQTLSEWFELYSDDVYHFLVYYAGSRDVEDLVQEVFIKAGRGMSNFKNESSPKTWLFTIARRVAIDESRKKKRRGLDEAVEYDDGRAAAERRTPEEQLLSDETKQALYEAINRLKTSYRDVVMMRAINECSIAESAAILGWKESKVKTTYHRAIKALQKQMSEKGDGQDAKTAGY